MGKNSVEKKCCVAKSFLSRSKNGWKKGKEMGTFLRGLGGEKMAILLAMCVYTQYPPSPPLPASVKILTFRGGVRMPRILRNSELEEGGGRGRKEIQIWHYTTTTYSTYTTTPSLPLFQTFFTGVFLVNFWQWMSPLLFIMLWMVIFCFVTL